MHVSHGGHDRWISTPEGSRQRGGGGAKEQDAPHAPCISQDIIPNLPSGLDLMGGEIEI